jgi:hypothetical protein
MSTEQPEVAHTNGEADTNVGIKDATVTVKKAVDGTPPPKKRRRSLSERPKLGGKIDQITVDPRVMEAAKEAMRPGQRLVIVDAECVRLVNR